jgi:hypothetical protein
MDASACRVDGPNKDVEQTRGQGVPKMFIATYLRYKVSF